MVLLNCNTVRGRRRRRVRERLHAWSATSPRALQTIETTSAEDARRHAADAAGRGVETVLAVGGDGTVQSAAAGLLDVGTNAGERPALAIAPLGRGNDLARSLGLARGEAGLEEALQGLDGRADRVLDVGVVEIDGEAHVFVNALGIGLDAAVARRARHIRLPGGGAYHVAAVLAILRERGPWRLIGAIDGQSLDREITLLHLGNGATTGGGYRLTPGARIDDGRLDTCAYLERKRRRILAMLPRAARGEHVGRPGIEIGQLERLDVRCDPPAPIHGDGEVFSGGAASVRLHVVPGALHLRMSP